MGLHAKRLRYGEVRPVFFMEVYHNLVSTDKTAGQCATAERMVVRAVTSFRTELAVVRSASTRSTTNVQIAASVPANTRILDIRLKRSR